MRSERLAVRSAGTVAGTGSSGFADGALPAAQFATVTGVTVCSGNIFVADHGNNVIRKIVGA